MADRVDPSDRPPPFNLEAERSVLGSIIINESNVWRVAGWLRPAHFYNDDLRTIYTVILNMAEAGTPIDLLTVRDGVVAVATQPQRLSVLVSSLVDGVPDAAGVERYARIVKRDADRRHAIGACDVAATAFWSSHDVKGHASSLLDVVLNLLDDGAQTTTESAKVLMVQAMSDVAAKIDGTAVPSGITTGYASLNAITHGYPRGAVTILGAPRKVGKSTFILNSGLAAAEDGKHALFFSIDMPKLFVRDRLLSLAAGVDAEFVKTGRVVQQGLYGGLSRDELLRMLMVGAQRVSSVTGSFDVNDRINDVAQIAAECTLRAKRGKLDIAYVDFVQQVESSGLRTDNEHRRITYVGNRLKNMARELDIAIVLAAQPNRTLLRGEKMTLRHLAESSSLEQVPRVAIMLHRPGAEHGATELPCELTAIVEKNEGPTGEVVLHAEMDCYRITEAQHSENCSFWRG